MRKVKKKKLDATKKDKTGELVIKHTCPASMGIVSFLFILTIIFVVAKITGYLDWDWWVVFSPLWGPPAVCCSACSVLIFVILIVIMIIVFVIGAIDIKDRIVD